MLGSTTDHSKNLFLQRKNEGPTTGTGRSSPSKFMGNVAPTNKRSLLNLPYYKKQLTEQCPPGPDPNAPKPILLGLARIYRGLGVSALRSVTTHGLLWTLFDVTAQWIDNLSVD